MVAFSEEITLEYESFDLSYMEGSLVFFSLWFELSG